MRSAGTAVLCAVVVACGRWDDGGDGFATAVRVGNHNHTNTNNTTTNRLRLHVYNNTALAGHPVSTALVDGLHVSIDPTATARMDSFSAELLGSLVVGQNTDVNVNQQQQKLAFACHFGNVTMAFLWIDDHMVCQTGAYSSHATVTKTDNPLRLLSKTILPVRLELYSTTAEMSSSTIVTVSVDVDVVSTSLSSVTNDTADDGVLNVPWTLSPEIAAHEQQRRSLQRNLTRGWGLWNHNSLLDFVHLPSGVYVRTSICNATAWNCVSVARPDDDGVTRPGILAHDFSYGNFYVASGAWNVSIQFGRVDKDELMVTLDLVSDNTGSDDDLYIIVSGGVLWKRRATISATNHSLTLSPYGLDEHTIYESQTLQDPMKETAETARDRTRRRLGSASSNNINNDNNNFVVPLRHGRSIELCSNRHRTGVTAHLQQQKKAELDRYSEYRDLAETRAAVQAGVLWNIVYVPVEAGPFAPVSRGWPGHACRTDPHTPAEWCYTHFDWDDIFASYMLSLDDTTIGKALAYSNMIQIIKSKTSDGFIPNVASGTIKSTDRTEPPVGATVLLKIYTKHRDKWLVELLFDDLLDWSNWFISSRQTKPLDLIVLGGSSMQNARFESGLDNSPMYEGEDDEMFDSSTFKMRLYDVGMSSLVTKEADALAQLAGAIGRIDTQAMLQQRAQAMRQRIFDHLWDAEQGVFCNRFINGTFSHRISPTSFYPLLAGAATTEQVEIMAERWLFNPSRFCISRNGDFAGNADSCYWGLPSISADDPLYLVGWIYWRGQVWGPMALLVYWGLEQYDDATGTLLPIARVARKALVSQMKAMMLKQYQEYGHICENYGPRKDTEDCTGDKFYHWGALTGFLSILEDGFY